ncbi:MAG: hypothetical protein LBL46_01320 [Rickettsiales bacterium]|jgi:hypothetical protein|nr:hypothetical protein [Rickettsiales bacterium]
MKNYKKIIKYTTYGVLLYIAIQGILAFSVWHRNMREMKLARQWTIEHFQKGGLHTEDLSKELDEQRAYFVVKAGYENSHRKNIINAWLRGYVFNSIFIITNHFVFRPFGLGY